MLAINKFAHKMRDLAVKIDQTAQEDPDQRLTSLRRGNGEGIVQAEVDKELYEYLEDLIPRHAQSITLFIARECTPSIFGNSDMSLSQN